MKRVRKAVLAGLGATVSALVGATLQKGGTPGVGEVVAAVLAGVLVGVGTWRVPNAAPTPPPGVTGPYVPTKTT